MKKLLPFFVVASALSCTTARAAEPQAQFINAQGVLIIPHLNLGSEIYYVQLNRSGAGYEFSLTGNSVLKITPAEGDDWAIADELVGEWQPEDQPGLTIMFGADGSYELMHPAEGTCVAGIERGSYSYSADTGVVSVRVTEDANGSCGLSHPGGAHRVSREGVDLLMHVYDPNYTDGQEIPQVVRLLPL